MQIIGIKQYYHNAVSYIVALSLLIIDPWLGFNVLSIGMFYFLYLTYCVRKRNEIRVGVSAGHDEVHMVRPKAD